MLLAATLFVLTVWLAFVWFCDPDRFRAPAGKRALALQHVRRLGESSGLDRPNWQGRIGRRGNQWK